MNDLDPRLLPILDLAEKAAARPGTEADLETLREIFAEAAMLLDLGNVLDVLDDLDDNDAHAVVAGQCTRQLCQNRAHAGFWRLIRGVCAQLPRTCAVVASGF